MSPSTSNFRPKWPTHFKNADFQSIIARSASAITPTEKSSIITNRKSMTSFSTSLRWTAYVAPKAPKGWVKNTKLAIFDENRTSVEKKSATKFLCVTTLSGKVVGHSLPYITLHKWFVGDALFNVNFGVKLNPPVPKPRFRSSLVLQLQLLWENNY